MPTEADWKLYRKLLPEWQERYMEKLCPDYMVLEMIRTNYGDIYVYEE